MDALAPIEAPKVPRLTFALTCPIGTLDKSSHMSPRRLASWARSTSL